MLAATTVGALSAPASAYAQAASGEQLWRTLHARFVALLNTGVPTQQSPGTTFLLLPSSVTFDPYVDETDANDLELVSQLLDRVPKGPWLFEDNGTRVSAIYRSILDYGEPIPRPTPPEEQQAGVEARQLLFTAGDMSKGNTELYARYLSLKAASEEAQAKAAAQPDSQVLRNEAQAARQRLETLGRKNQVEAALARLADSTRRSIFDLARKKYKTAIAVTGDKPLTSTNPAASAWSEDGGWTEVTFDLTSAPPALAAASPPPPPVWRRTPPGPTPSLPQRLSLAFELKRLRIERAWIEPTLLASKWRWSAATPNATKTPVSAVAGGVVTGTLPCLATQAFLVRNLHIRGSWTRTELRAIRQFARGSTELGFGPFSLVGRYVSRNNEGGTFAARPESQGFYSPEVELVGLVCDTLPPQP